VVRVTFPIREMKRVAGEGSTIRAGGLIAWAEKDGHFRVIRADYNRKEAFWQCYHILGVGGDIITTMAKPAESAYVRLRREGKKLTGASSRDGEEWRDYPAVEASWGEKLKIGVIAENASGAGFEVTFD